MPIGSERIPKMRSFLLAALMAVSGLPAQAAELTVADLFGSGVLLERDFPDIETLTVEGLVTDEVVTELGNSSCPADLLGLSKQQPVYVQSRIRLIEFDWDRDWVPGEIMYRIYRSTDNLQLIVRIPWEEQNSLIPVDCAIFVIATK